MSDVLIGQAYHLRFDPKLWRAQQPYAPLGTLYAASYLRARGGTPAFYDAMLARSEEEWASALDAVRPRIAVIYEDSFNYLTKMCLTRMRLAAERMIAAARARGCRVFVAGSDATDHPDAYLHAGADAVILGEGELTLADLVAQAEQGRDLHEVDGVAYLDARGVVMRTARRAFVRALDDLPRPAWDLVDVPRYRRIWQRRHGYFAMNVATTRGCPYHCNWCAKPIYGQRYAVRGVESVVDEMAWLARDYQPDQFSVVDDVFGLQPGWLERFATIKQQAGVPTPFRCLMRADQLTRERVRALAAAACRMVWMGAESGSQRVLDAMEKGVRIDQIRDAVRWLHDAGIEVGLFLQFGYPGEDWADVQATLDLVRDTRPDDIGVSVSYPLPGTRFHDRVRAELGAKQQWFDSDDLAMMYRATYPPAFYRVLHEVVHREFRAATLRRRLREIVDRPSAIRVRDVPLAAAWAYHRGRHAAAERRLARMARDRRPEEAPSSLGPTLNRQAAGVPTPAHESSTELTHDVPTVSAP